MEGKSSYFILLVIVAFLSITLAFLAIGFFFFGNGSSSPNSSQDKEVAVVSKKIPGVEELSNKVIFVSKNFNLKKINSNEIAVIVLSASMKHYKIIDKIKEEEIVAKIDFYSTEINSAIGTYFQGLTLDDVRQIGAKHNASEDLTKKINEILANNEEKASPLVYSIIFDYWFYQ